MEEERIKSLIRQSKLEINILDFEDNVMDAIREKKASKKLILRNIRLSWFFFIIGLGLGLVVTNLFSSFKFEFLGDNSNMMILVFEVALVAVLATQFDKLIHITFRK